MNRQSGALHRLECSSLRLRKSIRTTTTQLARGKFLAQAPELTIVLSATGRTRLAAMRSLASGIATQYNLLASMQRREQAPIHRKMLRSLHRFVEEAAFETNPAEARSTIASKTRIHQTSKSRRR
jgi:hypothetical protein